MILNEITKQFIRENLDADVPTLALKKAPVGTDISLALQQIGARQLLRKKVPEWSANEDLLFPSHLSIEQCSSEATAQYKASLVKGGSFLDLTAGLGVDCFFLSQRFQKTDYVEKNTELCNLARHNFTVLGASIEVHNETAEDYLSSCAPVDCIYIDPARRDLYGRKTVSITDCTPNVVELQDLLLQKSEIVMVKLSPMLDISKALEEMNCVRQIHVVAVGNECKELVFVMERDFSGQTELCCVNLQSFQPEVCFTMEEERNCPLKLAESIGKYLYEPNVALLKAGGFKLLCERFGVLKLHKNSHLYTSETLVPGFPGRVFDVEAWALYNKKVRCDLMAGAEKANVAVRNFLLSVDELRKTLKIGDGGEVYLFATTLKGERKVLVKTKKSAL